MITRRVTIDGNSYDICDNGSRRPIEEIYGLSTDVKPIEDIENATVFYEMDTQKLFMFDEADKVWLPQ